jgi:hypothetical protein
MLVVPDAARLEGDMAKVDELKDAIEGAVPGRQSSGRGRLPKAILVALLAGLAAWASRLEPVRSAAHTAVSSVRSRVSGLAGRGASAGQPAAATGTTPDWTDAQAGAGEVPGTDVATGEAAGIGAAGPTEMGAASPVSELGDEPPDPALPADSEEGRPAGV